ncbi:transcription factor 7-like [Festucalex cinctus]
MASTQVYGLLQLPNADFGMTSNQIQVNGTPMVFGHLPIRVIIGQDCYQLAPVTYLHPPVLPPTPKSSQRKRTTEPPIKLYIKKPPNAFMLFMKEQRPILKAQILNEGAVPQDSATVNKILGQKWKSLTVEEQNKYFKESERLSQVHATMYPDWSYRENYGKKKKRVWSRQATSTPAPEVPVQAPRPGTYPHEEPTADPVSTHTGERMGSAEAPSSSADFQHVGLEEDVLASVFQELEAALESSASSSASSLDEEAMTSYLYKQLEDLEAVEAAAEEPSASSSSTCRPEEELTFSFLKELESLEFEVASSSASFLSSFASCS